MIFLEAVLMNQDTKLEGANSWVEKDNLEQALLVGIHGAPEIKHDEKIYFLGEFKERVIRRLSIKQVSETGVYPEIIQALKDSRAKKLIINGILSSSFTGKYRELAMEMNKQYTVRNDSEFKGETGLVIVSDEAVNEQEIDVEEREIRLSRLGAPLLLIQAAGKKICDECFSKITEIDAHELVNYQELTWIDRLGGDTCPAHHEDE